MRRIVVGMTAATGAVQGIELLRRFEQCPYVQVNV
jgi:3-polyprenyl-4-hydroxybenzoate decarboxylase